jgi:RNAse (barnase) inhibitor barstar
MVSKLEEETRKLIALKLLSSVSSSFSDRAKRRFEKKRDYLGERLKRKGELPKDFGLDLELRWDDVAVNQARAINLSLAEFKDVNREAYAQFLRIRRKHKDVRRAYLEFGGEVDEDVYVGIVRDIMGKEVDSEQAERIYNNVVEMGELLGKERGGSYTALLPE